jgi:N,N'-diacetyllegionaminate synthase
MKTIIIAEAGVNHNGDLELAKRLVDCAAEAGADFVKFQTFKTEKLVTRTTPKAKYQEESNKSNTQFEMLQKLELNDAAFIELKQYCDKTGISFLSTGFDEGSIDFLEKIGVPFFKIPSGEITNKPYLEHIARKKKPVLMSTGMSYIDEISAALDILYANGLNKEQITLLHCNSGYPTPMADVNLGAITTLRNRFKTGVGLSDHTMGIEVPVAAVALGACVIEKHFTLDSSLPGPDQKASLEPGKLKEMVLAIRNIELALMGNGIKEPSPSELPNILPARKSIHLAIPISSGEVFSRKHLVMKRPGDGISPMLINEIVGKKCLKDLPADTKLEWDQLEK